MTGFRSLRLRRPPKTVSLGRTVAATGSRARWALEALCEELNRHVVPGVVILRSANKYRGAHGENGKLAVVVRNGDGELRILRRVQAPRRRKPHSAETRAKMREAWVRRKVKT